LGFRIWDCGFLFEIPNPNSQFPNRFMASGSAQGLSCEPRQIRKEATVAISACVAVKSEATKPILDFGIWILDF